MLQLVGTFDCDRTKHNWKLIRNLAVSHLSFSPRLQGCLRDGEHYLVVADFLERINDVENLGGQLHAEAMIRNQDAIPEDFKKYVLIFPGTIWVDHNKYFMIPYIARNNFGWYMNFYWSDLTLSGAHRIIVAEY